MEASLGCIVIPKLKRKKNVLECVCVLARTRARAVHLSVYVNVPASIIWVFLTSSNCPSTRPESQVFEALLPSVQPLVLTLTPEIPPLGSAGP